MAYVRSSRWSVRDVFARLAVTLLLVSAIWHLGCQPAWSPDGRHLLYLSRVADDRLALACFERDGHASRVLFVPPPGATPVPAWAGGEPLAVWQPRRAEALQVTRLALDRATPLGTSTVPRLGAREHEAPILAVGNELFTFDGGVCRIDPRTGAVVRKRAGRGEQVTLFALGDGVGYVAGGSGDVAWELGRVDVRTLERERIAGARPGGDGALAGPCAAARDGRRIAVALRDRTGALVVDVLADGEHAARLPLGDADAVACTSLAWAADGTTLLAGVLRGRDGETPTWLLVEATPRGVARETVVLRSDVALEHRAAAAAFVFAVAPDGLTAAASTAMLDHLPAERHGLYCVDLASPRRTVTRVPFPPAPAMLRIACDDACAALVHAWHDAWAGSAGARALDVVGDGGAGAADAPLAVRTGPAPAATAGDAAATVAHLAVAVAVHPDNAVPALTVEQLAGVLAGEARSWNDLGITLPRRAGRIVVHGRADDVALDALVRDLVLGGRPVGTPLRARSQRELLDAIARRRGALAVLAAAHLEDRVRAVPIARAAGERAVLPEPHELRAGAYPLARAVVLTTRAGAGADAAAFAAWLAGDDGRRATEAAGFVPAAR